MDGTEVDEEDYFSFLNSDATLMLLTPADQWRPAGLGMPKCACAADCKLYIYILCNLYQELIFVYRDTLHLKQNWDLIDMKVL